MNAPQTSSRPRHRDYTFLGITQSLCPDCLSVVPTKIITRNKRVYFRKQCPEHGTREDFVCSDVDRYDLVSTSLPAKLPAKTFVEPQRGCPLDCGLCTEHEQHTCIGVVEITDGCNLTCPMCYANSAPGQAHRSQEEVQQAIDTLVEAEGHAEVMQLSGGEPTLHPQLIELLDYALTKPIDFVMINTNGVRLAHDTELVDQLAERSDRTEIYFQLDCLDDGQMAKLRGKAGLLETKLQALDNLSRAGLNVTLVSTLQGGINDSAPADIVDFALGRSEITGLSFQPATYSGRYVLPSELEKRITFPDVIDSIANDIRNPYTVDDFFPLPCAHPNCHWLSLAVKSGETVVPLTQFVESKDNLDLLANGISFTREKTQHLVRQLAARMACGEGCGCGPAQSESNSLPTVDLANQPAGANEDIVSRFLERVMQQQAGARDMLRITITSFLDAYNFDVRRVMKCCTHHVLPSGHIIPFCAYNVLYREGHVPLPELTSK